MKSRGKIIFEGFCYTVMSGGPPWIDLLTRHVDKAPPSQGAVLLAFALSVVAVFTALKAFASSSTGDQQAIKAEVKAAVKEEQATDKEIIL